MLGDGGLVNARTNGLNVSLRDLGYRESGEQARLYAIDSGQLRWQGELWPGVPVDLRLQHTQLEDRPGHDDDDAAQEASHQQEVSGRRWQATLITTLPVLGKINTPITL